jgi:ribosomal protein S27E
MQKTTNIECSSCGADVVPRLVHHDVNNIFGNRRSEHICPICGITMYETGGGLSPLGKVWMSILLVIVVLGLLSNAGKLLNNNFFIVFILSFIVGTLVFRKLRNKSKFK